MSIVASSANNARTARSSGGGPFEVLSLFFAIASTGCASSYSLERASGIDARYRVERARKSADGGVASPGVGFYQRALGPLLGSDCRYFPSDSAHAQMLFRRCGAGALPIAHATARWLDKPDAARLGYSPVSLEDGIHYFRLKEECAWIE